MLDWFEKAKNDYVPGKFGYGSIAKKYGIKEKTVSDRFIRWKKSQGQSRAQKINLSTDNLLKDLQKEVGIAYLAERYGVSHRVLQAAIEDLKDSGYSVVEISGKYKINRAVEIQFNTHEENWNGEKIIRFGAVADTHLCNKWQQKTFLSDLYDRFKREGIKTIYHAGDLTDGYYKNRPAHIYELHKVGADEQADYVIENYPKREGIITKFISGNHDHTHIINGGADICKRIGKERADMEYLGQSNARVKLTPNCVLELNHPLDGSAYALSYSIQKYIESYSGGEKPNILLNGHHHKAMYVFYRNVHGFECGTCEDQTPWMKGKRLAAHMGGWIIEAHVDDDGTIKKCIGEFMPLYQAKQNDY
jgi:predicted phosphodiesterase